MSGEHQWKKQLPAEPEPEAGLNPPETKAVAEPTEPSRSPKVKHFISKYFNRSLRQVFLSSCFIIGFPSRNFVIHSSLPIKLHHRCTMYLFTYLMCICAPHIRRAVFTPLRQYSPPSGGYSLHWVICSKT